MPAYVDGFQVQTANNNLSTLTLGIGATGTSQGTGIALNTIVNIVTVCGAGANAAVLPPVNITDEVTVINQGATNLQLYPPSGHGIDALGLNANTCVLAGGGWYKIILANTNHWYTSGNGIINVAS